MDRISVELEKTLHSKTLKELDAIKQMQYAEIGYYFDILSKRRFVLQYIEDVITKKKSAMTEKFREAGEKRRINDE